MGPTYKIAELLKISPAAARQFCEQVRSLSGLGATLPYKIIAQHLAQHSNEAPSPQRIAEILRKDGLHVAPVKKVTPKKTNRATRLKPRKWNISRALNKEKRSRSGLEKPANPVPLPAYIVRTSYFDYLRVSEQKLEHCPHGVPSSRVCAICDPEKFREMTGMD